jgi:hypothetical protein
LPASEPVGVKGDFVAAFVDDVWILAEIRVGFSHNATHTCINKVGRQGYDSVQMLFDMS